MKKILMLFALSGLLSCAWIFAMDEDFKDIAPDDDETSYQNDEEDFKIGGEETDQLEEEKANCSDCAKDCEKIGYIDDEPGQ